MSIHAEQRQALIMTVSRDHDVNRLGMALMRDTLPTPAEDFAVLECLPDR